MNKIIPVAIAIIHKNDRFLLTERKGTDPDDDKKMGRVWHFPGGGIEFGEEIENTLKREIQEELGLDVSIEQQLPKIYSAIRPCWHGLLIPFLCSIKGEEHIVLDHESFQSGWFSREEILKLHILPFVTEMLEETVLLLKKG